MNSYKLSYTPAATAQIIQIATWYNEQKKGLGKRFKDHLKKEVAEIKKNPFTRSFRYDGVRFAIVKKFPYAAHYTIDEDIHTIPLSFMLFSDLRKTRIKWEKKHNNE